MFGINLGEFSVIAIIAIIVVGPDRLPKYAQQLGKAVREGRRMAMGLREQVREELGPDFEDVDWRKLDPRQYDPRRIIREALTEAWDDEPLPSSGATAAGAAAGGAAGAEGGEVVQDNSAAPRPADAQAEHLPQTAGGESVLFAEEAFTPPEPRQPSHGRPVVPYDLEAT